MLLLLSLCQICKWRLLWVVMLSFVTLFHISWAQQQDNDNNNENVLPSGSTTWGDPLCPCLTTLKDYPINEIINKLYNIWIRM